MIEDWSSTQRVTEPQRVTGDIERFVERQREKHKDIYTHKETLRLTERRIRETESKETNEQRQTNRDRRTETDNRETDAQTHPKSQKPNQTMSMTLLMIIRKTSSHRTPTPTPSPPRTKENNATSTTHNRVD